MHGAGRRDERLTQHTQHTTPAAAVTDALVRRDATVTAPQDSIDQQQAPARGKEGEGKNCEDENLKARREGSERVQGGKSKERILRTDRLGMITPRKRR